MVNSSRQVSVSRRARMLLLPRSDNGTSAAQNGSMTRVCPKCGAILLDSTDSCSFCEVSFETMTVSRSSARRADIKTDNGETEWRREVARRLGDYRARRHRLQFDSPQPGLPFRKAVEIRESKAEAERPRPRAAHHRRYPQNERVEICIQPELDFSNGPDDRAHPQTAMVPVASLASRRWAGILDAFFVSLTGAGFLAMFHSLGGEILLAKMDAAVYATVFYLFYALYFFLFTALSGATPGIQICGLTVVRLDGSLPDARQLLWRSFGYLLSGGTLLLGFVWALWDEDHFTWQDRISHTYVTDAMPFAGADPVEVGANGRTAAHK
jgi:uncharacterized RDD family membrane protein YckC